jgi:hypothetical protein
MQSLQTVSEHEESEQSEVETTPGFTYFPQDVQAGDPDVVAI